MPAGSQPAACKVSFSLDFAQSHDRSRLSGLLRAAPHTSSTRLWAPPTAGPPPLPARTLGAAGVAALAALTGLKLLAPPARPAAEGSP